MAINDERERERERESSCAKERRGLFVKKETRRKKQMRREKGNEKERKRGVREKQPSKRRVRDTTTLAQRELRDPPLYTCSPRN